MTRTFRPDPVDAELLEHLVDLASRAPSAGKTQGWHLVVLHGADTTRFWDITLPADRRDAFRWQTLLDAPVIALPLADPHAYVRRYAEPDKAAANSEAGPLGGGLDAWPQPYWNIDAAMAVNTLLLAAEDAGLGALFFGIFHGEHDVRAVLGIPDDLELLGALALGYPAEVSEVVGRSAGRPRRPAREIIHPGGW
ncbi:nitroreductase family protein [soil metagenome]